MQPGSGGELACLTPRELAVLQLIAEGNSNLCIAEQLRISFKTVSTYKGHLREKLHVDSNVELAEIARRNGLVAGQESGAGALTAETLPLELGMLRGLVDAAPNPMFVGTIEGRLLFCNQRFLDYYRISAEEALNLGHADARWFSPALRKTIPESFRRLVNEGVPFAVTNRIQYFHANSTGTDSSATGVDSVAVSMGAIASHDGSVALVSLWAAPSTTAPPEPVAPESPTSRAARMTAMR